MGRIAMGYAFGFTADAGEGTTAMERAGHVTLVRVAVVAVIGLFTVASLIVAARGGSGSSVAAVRAPANVPTSAPLVVANDSGTATDGDASHAHGSDSASEPLGEGEAHSHGTEVHVTTEQLLAAGKFVQDVKANLAQYTDIRAGMAAGYVQLTQDLPGIAAHFVNLKYLNDNVEMDPAKPEFLLYTKRLDGNWKLVGAMFYALPRGDTAPSFFGPLDVWHRHENLCFQAGGVKVAASQADCPGGLFTKETNWQLHVWILDGGAGVFAHDYAPINPGAFPGATRSAAQDLVTRQ